MRTLCSIIVLSAVAILAGCNKRSLDGSSCVLQHTSGIVTSIAGPDSIRVNESQAFTVDVSAPGICVADIEVTATPQNDTLYFLEADVAYSQNNDQACNCTTSEHHYKRLYISVPATGTISFSTPQGIGPSPTHTIRVY